MDQKNSNFHINNNLLRRNSFIFLGKSYFSFNFNFNLRLKIQLV